MEIVLSGLIGYVLGSLSPSALFARLKNKDLRKEGTGNLGATNTMLVMGKKFGVLVMIFDILKAFVAVKLAKILFPRYAFAGVIAGGCAVVGHIYPFYLRFKGGKGLASFGGFILGVDPKIFGCLLVIALASALVANCTVAIPISAAVLFPVFYWFGYGDVAGLCIVLAVCLLLILNHIPNVFRILRGDDIKVREYLKEHLLSGKN